MRLVKTIFGILILITVSLCIIYSDEIKLSVIYASNICIKSVIPSLLPISCLIGILCASGIFTAVPERLNGAFLFFISIISGYPIGAKTLNTLVLNDQIDKRNAERILPSLICGGPAFIISVVGMSIFQSINIGIRLYLCIIASNLLIFAIKGGFGVRFGQYPKNIKMSQSVIKAVKEATDSVIYVCAFVVLFSAVGELIKIIMGKNIAKYFIYALEVTSAVFNSKNIYTVCFVISFGGLCVIMQAISVAENLKINLIKLILIRLMSSVLACTFLKLSFIVYPLTNATITTVKNPPYPNLTVNEAFLFFFIFSLFVFLISVTKKIGKVHL